MQVIEGYYKGIPSYKYKIDCDCTRNKYNYIILKNKKMLTGIKWECVEFVRRYLNVRYNITFDLVDNVYDILNLRYFVDFNKIKPVFFNFFSKKFNIKPKVEDLILFHYKKTGHIGIVSKIINGNYIEICEQNWEKDWENIKYSRIINIDDKTIIGFLRFL